MRRMWVGAACLAASTSVAGPDGPTGVRLVLDNARVRVLRSSTALALADHPAAVIVLLEDGLDRKAGDAFWSGDRGAPAKSSVGNPASLVIVEPKESAPIPLPAPGATAPGSSPFTGISFRPLFENERVAVIRGRMEEGAQEAHHTHASDIVLVHLSGGAIEDTADGRTRINRWKPGDVEFEARGSSHAARNVGPALDAVLVTLKPQITPKP